MNQHIVKSMFCKDTFLVPSLVKKCCFPRNRHYLFLFLVPEVELKYDVFVSYSSEDQDWVLNSLFQIMTQNSYEVCIDFKDFTPGRFSCKGCRDYL